MTLTTYQAINRQKQHPRKCRSLAGQGSAFICLALLPRVMTRGVQGFTTGSEQVAMVIPCSTLSSRQRRAAKAFCGMSFDTGLYVVFLSRRLCGRCKCLTKVVDKRPVRGVIRFAFGPSWCFARAVQSESQALN